MDLINCFKLPEPFWYIDFGPNPTDFQRALSEEKDGRQHGSIVKMTGKKRTFGRDPQEYLEVICINTKFQAWAKPKEIQMRINIGA